MPGKFEVNGCKISEKTWWFMMMASSSALSTTRKQQTSQETDEAFDANVARSASFDDFARQQFFKNRKVIIRNVPRVTYDVRMNELIV